MRILFLSNYYPPFSSGGYEQWCLEVANTLVDRGHHVLLLTSRAPGGSRKSDETGVQVHRLINMEVEGGLFQTAVRLLRARARLEQENLHHVHRLISDFQPDVAMIWGMWNIPRSVPALVEHLLPGRVAYYLCDYWLSLPSAYVQRWWASSRRKLTRLPKWLVGRPFLFRLAQESPIGLLMEHPICVSFALRDLLVEAGVNVEHAKVIHGGTQVREFVAASNQRRESNGCLKLLYAGRLAVEKGVHTAVRAMKLLADQQNHSVTLDIVGKGAPDYEAELKALVRKWDLNVTFRGLVPRSEMPRVLSQYDALIFPSEWEEPFARIVLEAMAAGLVVLGTTTGGTGEILVEGETGLTFPAGDFEVLAYQIRRLLGEPALRHRLAATGHQRVVENFTFEGMVDQMEVALRQLVIGEGGKT